MSRQKIVLAESPNIGYQNLMFSAELLSEDGFSFAPEESVEFESGVSLNFQFNITAGYDTQHLQVKIKMFILSIAKYFLFVTTWSVQVYILQALMF